MTEQYFFYYWLFKVQYSRILKYRLNEKEGFTEIEDILRKPEFIKSTESLLKCLDKMHGVNVNIPAKNFLSAFMMVRFSDMINYDPERRDLSFKLHHCCEKLVDLFLHLDNHIKRVEFLITLGRYKLLFEVFREQDRLDMIESLIVTLLELERNYENTDGKYDQDTLKCIKSEIDKTIKRIRQFNGLELLEKYRKRETELKTSVEQNMKQAFWDIYRAELEKPKPNYGVFIPLIREVIEHVERCVPNNPDFIEEYTDALDLQYIEDIINEDVIEKCDLDKIVTITIDTIKRLHSAVNDKNIEEWRKQLRNEDDISKYLIGFFQETFTRLNVIYEEKLEFSRTLRK
jgi:hypothetical protein